MNSLLKRRIYNAFRDTDLTVEIGDGFVNVARPDGVHCEFNTCYGNGHEEDVLTGTYTIDGVETELDLHVPDQISDFVEACEKILDFEVCEA